LEQWVRAAGEGEDGSDHLPALRFRGGRREGAACVGVAEEEEQAGNRRLRRREAWM
jgi:hypothetical protein